MALTADLEMESMGPIEELAILAGAADTLYKGAMLCIGTDGYIAVPTNGAGEINIGVCKKQIVSVGAHAEYIEILTGRFWIYHSGAAQTDVGALAYPTDDGTLAHGSPTASALGLIVGMKANYLLVDTRIKAI